jgi:hypothetical protein
MDEGKQGVCGMVIMRRFCAGCFPLHMLNCELDFRALGLSRRDLCLLNKSACCDVLALLYPSSGCFCVVANSGIHASETALTARTISCWVRCSECLQWLAKFEKAGRYTFA